MGRWALGRPRRSRNGLFITFEGMEGSGKTTQIARLAERLKSQGRRVLETREPGGTTAGEQIRQILLDHENTILTPMTEVFLVLAARTQHLHEVIRPAMDQGAIVLCDRFADSTLAYQGYGRGLNVPSLRQLNTSATRGLTPDLTILFDLPVPIGLARRREHAHANRLDLETNTFHNRIRKGFLQLAKRESDRIKIVDARAAPDEVFEAVIKFLSPLIRLAAVGDLPASPRQGRKASSARVG